MIRVKVNSKSEIVEGREGKSALYCCNLLLGRQDIVESCYMWSYGLNMRSIRLIVVKVVISGEGTCNTVYLLRYLIIF